MAINILFSSARPAGSQCVPGQPGSFRLRPVYVCLLCSLMATTLSASAREYFNPAFLMGAMGEQEHIDLSAYENAGYVAPGRYLVDIYMNQNKVDNREIEFRLINGHLQPVLTVTQFEEYGVNIRGLPAFQGKASGSPITDLTKQIPHARAILDFARLRLDLSVPQAVMQPHHSGRVDPSLWDNGIPAFLMNYTVNGSEGRYDGQETGGGSRSRNLFASFRNGLNLGPWRLRSTQTYSYNRQRNEGPSGFAPSTQTQWQVSNTYLQRNVQSLRGEFTAGETYTGGDIFDSIPLRGMKLASEEAMLPDSQRGFAPEITGVASSNAQVTVSQNGYTVYQTTVAPGPFRFTDLYTIGDSGDLTVMIKEEDGSTRVSTLSSSFVPMMQRPGGIKYELTAGQYHGGNLTDGSRSPVFALGTLVYGLPHNITLYGGGLIAGNYQSGVLGSGVSLGAFGALSADVTFARAQLQGAKGQENNRQQGQAYRVKYAKNLISTGTGIDLAAYRYSTPHYYSFSDVNSMGYSLNEYQVPWALDRRQSTWQVNLHQTLGRWGSLYASGTRNDYWNGRTDNNLNLGYNAMLMGISYNLSYNIYRMEGAGHWSENRQVSFNMQVPLSLFGSSSALRGAYTRYTVSRDSQGNTTQQTGISGMLWDNRLNYNLQQGWGNSGQQNSRAVSLSYQGSQGNINLGYNDSANSHHFTYGASGALLIHPYGMTLSRSLGDEAVLVRAPGAKGVTVGDGNVQTDWRGYAVLPGGSVYQKNTINLDPSTLPDGVDIDQTSKNVYPTRGAVTLANYQVRSGSQLLLTLTHHGKPVPFGATATLEENATQAGGGIVGDNGRVYLSGMPPAGRVKVKWGNGATQQCTTRYQVPSDTPGQLVQADAVCL
ncbi:fimbria/pilus outer membrane usher protein [Photorhabdus khanii]|uniref:Fimbrial biogenesis outer membrane usher protein n=1 Tax=Photorhabdus khanii subsp. guanajuatensis TaxID=2100166 RepID=A0A4R4JSU8_9GAMM|nr:fimbria/pilus outer membrane usher protein [Photorhabdus khanii]TDB56851.1 fimbrial biogenesis outer membrane usher protein [Photorhabdus khanii subsp. guanajuatensis]